jgi:hypothetical protein
MAYSVPETKNAAKSGIISFVTPGGWNSNHFMADLQKINELRGT